MADYDEVTRLAVHTFRLGNDKDAALKPLEEAAEAFGAWQTLDSSELGNAVLDRWLLDDLADEIADCVQACANLAARYGIDLQAAMVRCEGRNRERGRYEE